MWIKTLSGDWHNAETILKLMIQPNNLDRMGKDQEFLIRVAYYPPEDKTVQYTTIGKELTEEAAREGIENLIISVASGTLTYLFYESEK